MGKRKVLVIEDERDIAELLALRLEDLGCDTTQAADGHEGMRQAFARNWDLVILDLRLPGGAEALTIGPLKIDTSGRQVTIGDEPRSQTARI